MIAGLRPCAHTAPHKHRAIAVTLSAEAHANKTCGRAAVLFQVKTRSAPNCHKSQEIKQKLSFHALRALAQTLQNAWHSGLS
jgi:hypothetical protein